MLNNLSNNIIFTSHIKEKWEKTKTFRFLKLSQKSKFLKDYFPLKKHQKKINI